MGYSVIMLVMGGLDSLLGFSLLYCRLWEVWGSLLGLFGYAVVYGSWGFLTTGYSVIMLVMGGWGFLTRV